VHTSIHTSTSGLGLGLTRSQPPNPRSHLLFTPPPLLRSQRLPARSRVSRVAGHLWVFGLTRTPPPLAVLFLSCIVWCCSCRVFVCVTCFSSHLHLCCVLLVVCVCVCVGVDVLFSVGVCGCYLLIFLHIHTATSVALTAAARAVSRDIRTPLIHISTSVACTPPIHTSYLLFVVLFLSFVCVCDLLLFLQRRPARFLGIYAQCTPLFTPPLLHSQLRPARSRGIYSHLYSHHLCCIHSCGPRGLAGSIHISMHTTSIAFTAAARAVSRLARGHLARVAVRGLRCARAAVRMQTRQRGRVARSSYVTMRRWEAIMCIYLSLYISVYIPVRMQTRQRGRVARSSYVTMRRWEAIIMCIYLSFYICIHISIYVCRPGSAPGGALELRGSA